MHNRFTRAELKAKRVLAECGLVDPTAVPISDIIFGRGSYYEEKPLQGKEGEIVTVGPRSIITINADIAFETKKRFAAAHELGHYEMHRGLATVAFDTEYELVNWYQSGSQETEANEFASEFLMPSELFYSECRARKFGPQVIEHLANRFLVSKTAAILKFVNRGNHPVCIVYCKDNKMKWWKRSHDFRYFLEFTYDQHPPTGSVAYEVFTSGRVYPNDEQKQQIWKSDWFRMRDDESDTNESDTKFYEYCLHARSFNYTISIIWED